MTLNRKLQLTMASNHKIMKEIEIKMVVSVPDFETEDSVSNKFIELAETNKWLCGGIVKELEGTKVVENNKEYCKGYEEGFNDCFDVDDYNKGWNEALQWASEQIELGYVPHLAKEEILKGLKKENE